KHPSRLPRRELSRNPQRRPHRPSQATRTAFSARRRLRSRSPIAAERRAAEADGDREQERRAQSRGRLRPRRHRRRATERQKRAEPSGASRARSRAVDFAANYKGDIKDPEHPYSLEQLNVVTEDSVELNDENNYVRVTFTPTVEHCSMATVIGLCIRVKLIRSLPPRYKVDIRVAPGSHSTEAAVNKQLNDKERVAAALENPNLLDMVEECLSPTFD
ncbi:unnamed protein product, partial [Urochloa humidicola]